jgi:hypothetical protein
VISPRARQMAGPALCFTPVASPESNGLAEALVRTLKRDYVRLNPLPDAVKVLRQLHRWFATTTPAPMAGSACALRESSSETHSSTATSPVQRGQHWGVPPPPSSILQKILDTTEDC